MSAVAAVQRVQRISKVLWDLPCKNPPIISFNGYTSGPEVVFWMRFDQFKKISSEKNRFLDSEFVECDKVGCIYRPSKSFHGEL